MNDLSTFLVVDFIGRRTVSSADELRTILRGQNEEGFNSFSVGRDPGVGPWMSMLTARDLADVHFFPKDTGDSPAGFHSVGHLTHLDEMRMTNFRLDTPLQVQEVCNYQIVPLAQGIEAIVEFFITNALPRCLEWEEL